LLKIYDRKHFLITILSSPPKSKADKLFYVSDRGETNDFKQELKTKHMNMIHNSKASSKQKNKNDTIRIAM
jgi:hypothetical protein